MSGAAVVVHNLANAIKATGALVEVTPNEFLAILQRSENALVVHAPSGVFRTTHKYLTSYKGLVFYTKVSDELVFRGSVELIEAKRINIPEM